MQTFKVGDKAVYPAHGVAEVTGIESKEISGTKHTFYILRILDNELRGTLGLRAGSARHARTIRHLVAELIEVESHNGMALAERLDDSAAHGSVEAVSA